MEGGLSQEMKKENEEIMELSHEADPVYRKVFYIVFAILAAYLAFIFLRS